VRVLPLKALSPIAAALCAALATSALAEVPPLPDTLESAQAAAPAPAPAVAAVKKRKAPPRFVFTFPGRGYGHGVGMSQYGAYGAALAGRSAEQILAHYYRGTTLSTLPPTAVRVLLAGPVANVKARSGGAWTASVEGNPLTSPVLPVNADLVASRAGAGVVLRAPSGAELVRAPGALRLTPAAGGTVTFRGIRYRGTLRLIPVAGGITVVNHVDLEQYLPGVVPREMPAQWGERAPAALEAQAIAARSYAMATRRSGEVFDMYADERSQVYGGASAEDPRTNRAVAATAGRVVTFDGRIVTTFFFSTSGGMTENVENVFRGTARPFLVSARDAAWDARSPHHVWRDPKTFTDAQLARLLGTKRPVLRIVVVRRGVSPRVRTVRIITRTGAVKEMSGAEVRRALGLRDTWFSVRRRVQTPATLRLVTALPPRG
jgi:stage II sporulation protein D